MRTFRIGLLVALLAAAGVSDLRAAGDKPHVGVSVTPVRDKVLGWSIETKVTNLGDRPIVVSDAYLPWTNRYAMVVAVFNDKRPNILLSPGYPVDDPLFNLKTIPPGSSISGVAPLANYASGLAEGLRTSNMVVLWSYQLVADDGTSSDRTYGGFALPADGPVVKR